MTVERLHAIKLFLLAQCCSVLNDNIFVVLTVVVVIIDTG